MPDQPAPADYARLTPDTLLGAVESLGFVTSGQLLALNSYENRVYQVGLEDAAPLIAKFYRPQRWSDAAIIEEHAFAQELAAHEIPVVAPLQTGQTTLHRFEGYRFAVYPRQGGHWPELGNREERLWMGRFIGRIHAVGAARPFEHRPALDIDSHGTEPRDWLLASGLIPQDILAAWSSAAALALDGVQRCYERAGNVAVLRLHGDCHGGNILWTDEGPHFVDFDDARTGPAVQDLWMLLSGDRASMARQLLDVLAGYEDFCDFDRRELCLIEALRTLRLIHYSAWIARRWDDPAFPAAFPWFGTQRYWQDRILELKEQIGLMDEPPLYI